MVKLRNIACGLALGISLLGGIDSATQPALSQNANSEKNTSTAPIPDIPFWRIIGGGTVLGIMWYAAASVRIMSGREWGIVETLGVPPDDTYYETYGKLPGWNLEKGFVIGPGAHFLLPGIHKLVARVPQNDERIRLFAALGANVSLELPDEVTIVRTDIYATVRIFDPIKVIYSAPNPVRGASLWQTVVEQELNSKVRDVFVERNYENPVEEDVTRIFGESEDSGGPNISPEEKSQRIAYGDPLLVGARSLNGEQILRRLGFVNRKKDPNNEEEKNDDYLRYDDNLPEIKEPGGNSQEDSSRSETERSTERIEDDPKYKAGLPTRESAYRLEQTLTSYGIGLTTGGISVNDVDTDSNYKAARAQKAARRRDAEANREVEEISKQVQKAKAEQERINMEGIAAALKQASQGTELTEEQLAELYHVLPRTTEALQDANTTIFGENPFEKVAAIANSWVQQQNSRPSSSNSEQ
jgi:regulator of protease activity HflC (stomatin/prohibitin superfamily)